MAGRMGRWWSTILGLVGLGLAVTGGILLIVGLQAPWPASAWGPRGALYPGIVGIPTIGWLLTRRRPQNPIGWLLALSGISFALNYVGLGIAVVAHDRGATTWGSWGAWVVEWAWVPGVVLLLAALIRFPSGHPPRRARRLLTAAIVLGLLGPALHEALQPGAMGNVDWYDNPLAVSEGSWEVLGTVLGAGYLALMALIAAALATVATRFVGSSGIVKQQLRWVVYASLPFALSMLLLGGTQLLATARGAGRLAQAAEGPLSDVAILANAFSLSLLVGAVAVAILRYRLYDLDRIVSRALTYTALTGTLVGIYLLTVVVLGAMLRGLFDSSDTLVVAASTLFAAALFSPLRRRLQETIDRRLHRQRYDAHQAVVTLGAQLGEVVEPGEAQRRILAVVGQTLAPATAALWLSEPAGSRGADR